jgi:N-methylhydantoinase B/oxoprolinase/acetone carboxylase alpha subunit
MPGWTHRRRSTSGSSVRLRQRGGLFGGKDAIGTGGGGGYGNAWEREPYLVREDVIDGYVTREGAKRDYGVVLKEDLSIDKKATQKRRKAMQKRVA